MDVAPTIISLAGLHKPAEFGSRAATGAAAPHDLTPWMIGAATLPPLIAFQRSRRRGGGSARGGARAELQVDQEVEGRHREELYDLAKDPGEHQNLVRTDRVADTPLRQELAAWRDTFQGTRTLSQTVELSEDQKERLRALGYLK
jgi:arylsulfatase A-like enzyme